ncbi:MAG TPA: transglutaminase family protein [Steroidobacteraceae bacterium]|jgi:transglutaminase-like putative cysteine protease
MSALHYAVRHETRYYYGREVAHSHQLLHLTPRSDCARQACLTHRIAIEPSPAVRSEHLDAFGNRVTRVELDRPHDELSVLAEMVVSLEAPLAAAQTSGEAWETVRDGLTYHPRPRDADWLEAMRFRAESPFVRIKSVFSDFARDCLAPGGSVLAVAGALMARVHAEFTYAPGETEIATPLLEVFHKRRGVCQDYAHFMVACLRSAGLAARYVSGYLRTQSGALIGADASHAWVAVFAPPHGWVEFDPTNNLRVAQEHVALSWGRDFGDVSPLRGVILGGGSHSLSVSVSVQPRPEVARA